MPPSEPSTEDDLTAREAAVVGMMRRGEKAEQAIFNYAMNFGAEEGSTSGP